MTSRWAPIFSVEGPGGGIGVYRVLAMVAGIDAELAHSVGAQHLEELFDHGAPEAIALTRHVDVGPGQPHDVRAVGVDMGAGHGDDLAALGEHEHAFEVVAEFFPGFLEVVLVVGRDDAQDGAEVTPLHRPQLCAAAAAAERKDHRLSPPRVPISPVAAAGPAGGLSHGIIDTITDQSFLMAKSGLGGESQIVVRG